MKKGITVLLLVLVICGIACSDSLLGQNTQEPNEINNVEIRGEEETSFEFVKADKYFVPPADDVVAILAYLCGDCNVCPTDCEFSPLITLIGNKKEAEKIVGKPLEPWKLIEGREWLDKIMDEYCTVLKEAEERNFKHWCSDEAVIVFVTKDKGYVRCFSFDEEVVYDEYMESVLLWDYMKELGFIPTTPRQANEYFIPPKDETKAIVVYQEQYCQRNFRQPLAIFGDKELAQKLLYGDKELVGKILADEIISQEADLDESFPGKTIEPKKAFEGRGWLEKIMDAYGAALKKAKEEGRNEIRGFRNSVNDGSIVFVTKHEAYKREIRIGESTIYDDDMDSEELKTYFDKLGLVDELLVGKPPKEYEVFVAGDHFIPQADDTVAVLLYSRKKDPNDNRILLALFGDEEETEKVMGKSLKPKKVIKERNWLEKLVDEYEAALDEAGEERYELRGIDGYIWFITSEKGYIRWVGISENTIFETFMQSNQLKNYFDELGLTDELLGGTAPQPDPMPAQKIYEYVFADGRFIPAIDETKAILLYPRYAYGDKPLAIFSDDKELTDEIVGRKLQPKNIVEGREWLEKIMNAYEDAFKRGKEEGYYCRYKENHGDIWFVTEEKGYIREICVDTNSVYEKYMESGQLKKYFDELGLTKELLAGEPNKKESD